MPVSKMRVGNLPVFRNRLRSSRVRRYDHLETEELTTEFLGDSSDSDGEFNDILLHK